MRREQLIDTISEEFPQISKLEINRITNIFIEVLKKALIKRESVELRGFGTFFVKKRKPKKARNPRTGTMVMVEERWVPCFKGGSLLKKMVKEGNYFKVTKNKKGSKG
ncbi:MAG: integration host factor subunit beta [bacterium]|nr:integration host factor subunit beta [bacterium]